MINEITKEHVVRVALFGACKLPRLGSHISEYKQSDLIWVEKVLTDLERKELKRPLWTYSGYGSGSGYGNGNGDGYGDGNGNGDGDGYGYG